MRKHRLDTLSLLADLLAHRLVGDHFTGITHGFQLWRLSAYHRAAGMCLACPSVLVFCSAFPNQSFVASGVRLSKRRRCDRPGFACGLILDHRRNPEATVDLSPAKKQF
jgi:hypothetical protein